MKKILISLYFLTAMTGLAASAQSIQSAIEAIASDATFSQAIVGICARTEDGHAIAEINPDKMMVPASNMKLISTGAALNAFGPNYQFETSIAHDGHIDDGTLFGNLYIIGGGDPTTGSKDSIAISTERTFAEWEAIIKANGIRKIEGHVIGDGRRYEGMAEEPTWLWNDIGTYYGAGVTGLMFYENMLSFSVSAGEKPGASVNIKPHYPETPWMSIRHNGITGKNGTGDQLYMYTSDLDLAALDQVELFSVLHQVSFTSYGNTVFSNISLLIDNLAMQKSVIGKKVADFALITYVDHLLITTEQAHELIELLDEKYKVKSLQIDFFLI